MSVYTKQDLTIMQSWSLERKIQVTQAKILEWYYHYNGNVCVSFSGGKDSTVLLDLARRVFPDIPAVFVDTGLEYPEIRDFVKTFPNVDWLKPEMPFNKVIEQYGFPVVSKDVAKRIYYARRGSEWAQKHLQGTFKNGNPSIFNKRYVKWARLVDAPFLISDHCCEVMKKKPFHVYTKQTGKKPIIGTLASDSIRRQSAYLVTGCNAFHKKEPSSQPMSFWLEADVLRYLKLTGIPYCPIYGDIVEENGKLRTTGAERTGCMFCMFGVHRERQPNRFQRMEQTHPKQYDYCINKLGCGAVLDYIGVPYKGGA
jgi:3'-phosphoadenosine 5'-phosphosulfate sulfotransferase (PAPS reductase)/FAD synthetase